MGLFFLPQVGLLLALESSRGRERGGDLDLLIDSVLALLLSLPPPLLFRPPDYMNRLNKMQAIKDRDLGVSALQEALLYREAGMLDDIKDRTR